MDTTPLWVLFLLLLLPLLSCFLTSSDAVLCYSCSSDSDGNCKHKFNNATISTCDYGETCYKAYAEKGSVTIRSCGPKTTTGCWKRVGHKDRNGRTYDVFACFCENDFCNVGLKTFSSSAMLVSCTLVSIFFRQHVH